MDRELYHHGIKGQRWGVRRFQNKDGSLTSKGKSRYRKGAEIFREHSKLSDEKEAKLKKSSKEYQQLKNEYTKLTDKYDLDNQWGHENDSAYKATTRNFAQIKRDILEDDINRMDDVFSKKAEEYANKEILKKYGDTALSDMKHFQNVNAVAAAAGVLAAYGAYQLYSYGKNKDFDKKAMKQAFG